MDNLNPDLVWFFGGVLCFVSVLAFLGLHRLGGDRFAVPEAAAAPLM